MSDSPNSPQNPHEKHRDRLREKFESRSDGLAPHEILELLLFYSIPRVNVNPLAHRLLGKFGSLSGVLHATVGELKDVEGVGDKTAVYLSLLGKAMDIVNDEKLDEYKFFNLEDITCYVTKAYRHARKEYFTIFYIAKGGKVISKKILTSNHESYVEYLNSEISSSFPANKNLSVVLVHNHLSGCPMPSLSDDKATESLCLLFKMNGFNFFDHVIVSGDTVFSYMQSGKLSSIHDRVDQKMSF